MLYFFLLQIILAYMKSIFINLSFQIAVNNSVSCNDIYQIFSLFDMLWYFRFGFWNLEDTNSFMLPGSVTTSNRTICSLDDLKFQLFSHFVTNSMNVSFNL